MSHLLLQITFEPLTKDYGLPVAIMGMLVVFMALVLVSSFIVFLPHLMAVLDRLHPKSDLHTAKAPTKKSKSASKRPDELSEELQVVIAAAVAEVIGAPHRIVHTRPLSPEEHSWSLEGRLQQHSSHGRSRDGR